MGELLSPEDRDIYFTVVKCEMTDSFGRGYPAEYKEWDIDGLLKAQLAKSQEVCPDCDNGKIYVEITPWKANVEDCPTCQGTGKKLKVDSPKLTEEIVEILREFTTFNHDDKLITFSPRAAAQKLIRLGYCNALLEGETKKVFDERDSSSR